MKKIVITTGLLIFTLNSVNGQSTTENGTPLNQKFGFVAGYYGFQFKNPGFQIGLENYMATTSHFQVVGGLYAQFHHQKDRQTSIALNARIGQRYTTKFGLMLESHLGIGVQQTFYTSKVYDLTANPIAESTLKTNKTGAMPNIALGVGYDFSKKTKLPVTLYVRPNVSWLYPDKNLVFKTTGNIETGVIYKPTFKK